jgi:hypothetical protein
MEDVALMAGTDISVTALQQVSLDPHVAKVTCKQSILKQKLAGRY